MNMSKIGCADAGKRAVVSINFVYATAHLYQEKQETLPPETSSRQRRRGRPAGERAERIQNQCGTKPEPPQSSSYKNKEFVQNLPLIGAVPFKCFKTKVSFCSSSSPSYHEMKPPSYHPSLCCLSSTRPPDSRQEFI